MINDFGEKIGGARKDVWKERGLMVEDLDGMTQGEKEKYVKKRLCLAERGHEILSCRRDHLIFCSLSVIFLCIGKMYRFLLSLFLFECIYPIIKKFRKYTSHPRLLLLLVFKNKMINRRIF